MNRIHEEFSIRSFVPTIILVTGLAGLVSPTASNSQNTTSPELFERDWIMGPATGYIGDVAEIFVPSGYAFGGAIGVRDFLESNQNPVTGRELGILLPEGGNWFTVFEFDPIGYVRDDEKNRLNSKRLLKSIREDNEEANQERIDNGWPTMEIIDWEIGPSYDESSRNLVWAIRAKSSSESIINYNVRLLGRRGVMQAVLVADPGRMRQVVDTLNLVLAGFHFTTGDKYTDFVEGDRVATFGLTSLISENISQNPDSGESRGPAWIVGVSLVLLSLAFVGWLMRRRSRAVARVSSG